MKIQQYKMRMIASSLNADRHGMASRLSEAAQNWVLSARRLRLKSKKS